MTGQKFVIDEEQLALVVKHCEMHLLARDVRSRTLSEELMKEREKTMDDLCNLFRWTNKEGNFRPWNIGHIEQVIRKYRESLRSEQP